MNKKVIRMAGAFLLSTSLYGQTISLNGGWQLLGATEDINVSTFSDGCAQYLWKYDAPSWKLAVVNGGSYTYNGETFSDIKKGDGFWVKSVSSSGSCVVDTNSIRVDPEVTPENTVILKTLIDYNDDGYYDFNSTISYILNEKNQPIGFNDGYFTYTFSYDDSGNMKTQSMEDESPDINGNGKPDYAYYANKTFNYDSSGNMTTFSSKSTNVYDGNVTSIDEILNTYSYDTNGNMLSSSSTDESDRNADGTVDYLYKYSATYSYDTNGNALSSSTTSESDSGADGTVDSLYKSSGT
ncbi:MAG: hypothetical protein U9N42_10780, partial [Campylobacterota bacterium]|nr:hypothetical protein [Campylobacterota bacterium]